jgi:hypothetical protein
MGRGQLITVFKNMDIAITSADVIQGWSIETRRRLEKGVGNVRKNEGAEEEQAWKGMGRGCLGTYRHLR